MVAKKQRKPISLILKWLGMPLLFLAVALFVVFGLVQTPWAKRGLATLMSREVGAYSVTVANVTGLIPFRARTETARVADADGEFLRLNGINLNWSPLSLSRGVVEVDEIRVDRAELLRTPRQAASKKTEPRPASLPPLSVIVHDLSLPRVQLGEPVLGQAAVFSANAAGHYRSRHDFSAQARVKRLDRDGLAGRIRINSRQGTAQITGHVSAPPDSLVDRLFPAPLSAPLQCSLKGTGKRGLWHGELDLTEGEFSLLDSAFTLRMKKTKIELQLEGDAHVPEISDIPESLQWLPGTAANFNVDGHFDPSRNRIRIRTARIATDHGELSGNGQVSLSDNSGENRFNAVVEVDIPALAPFLPADSPQLAGAVRAEGRVQGSFDQFSATLDGVLSECAVGSFQPGEVRFALHAPSLPADRACDIALSTRYRDALLQLNARCAYEGDVFFARALEFRGPSTTLNGSLHVDTANATLRAALKGHVDSLSLLNRFVDIPVKGRANLIVSADGPLKTPEIRTRIDLQDLAVGPLSVAKATLETHIVNLAATENSTATLTLHEAKYPAATVEKATVNLVGNRQSAELGARLRNPRPAGVSDSLWSPATVTADARWRDSLLTADIKFRNDADDHLEISGELPLERVPDSFRFQPAGTISGSANINANLGRLSPLLLPPEQQVSGTLRGTFRLDGPLAAPKVEGTATLDNGRYEHADLGPLSATKATLEAHIVNLAATGNSTATLTLHEAKYPAARVEKATLNLVGNRQSAELGARLRNPRPAGVSESLWSPATVTADARWRDSVLTADIKFRNDADDHLEISGELPVERVPGSFRFQPAGTISGSADINANLGRLSPLLLPPEQQVSGTLRGTFRLDGPLAAPKVKGTATLDNGRYEHAGLGAVLENLRLTCRAEGRKLRITNLSAEDGEDGTAKVDGHIELAENGVPQRVHLSLQLNSMHLVRLHHIGAYVSGNAKLRQENGAAGIEGTLFVSPVELRIPTPAPKGMKGIDLVAEQQTATRSETKTEKTPKNRTADVLPLNIKVSIHGQCFLRGRGINSEWSGDLHVTGTQLKPEVSGTINLVRGHVNILTKRFELEEGKVSFANQTPPSPALHILAVHEKPDLRVNLQVTGTVNAPELTLASVPSLPRDEILSRLLFDRELGEITPQMAVKLALAVRTLITGKMGLLQRFRSGLGLDTLELKTSEGDQQETVVGVGKYLGEDVYFHVERGMAQGSTQVAVELELTPHLSLESQAGGFNQGIKFKWRYRY